ncbi:MAG: TIGR04282 family arsenosugar biosynthesis glycosyltransferase [Bacteroidota bacterium]
MKELLIIFYRNPVLGKVKTRLAATLGDEAALAIYLRLVQHTREVTQALTCDKWVYYSDYVDTEDNWDNAGYAKHLQHQRADLGERMRTAFERAFHSGYQSVCIIGTDCWQLTPSIVAEAFTQLKSHHAVLGPAHDGGYYLLGMTRFYGHVFENKKWSTETVASETLQDFEKAEITCALLPTLHDIDEAQDLAASHFPINQR